MKALEAKGKTVDEAIFNGLNKLGVSLDEVSIEIIEDGTKGLFGIGKSAKVRLTEKEGLAKNAENFLNGLFLRMDLNAELISIEDEDSIKINVSGKSMGKIIGRRGETLDAIQYLTSLVINRGAKEYKKLILDTENYRKKREETLIKLAKKLAGKAKQTGKKVVLEPMNPYERRILHSTLQQNPDVMTYSEGEEPFRRVVISVKKNQ